MVHTGVQKCINTYVGEKTCIQGYRSENRCILREYRCIWEKRGVYSFMHDEYWCILVFKGVNTRIFVKKRVFKGYRGGNRCISLVQTGV